MTNGILRWMHRKTANSRAVHFLPHHYFWAQLFPFLLSSVRIFACYLVELIKIGTTPSVRLSTHVHATLSQGLAAIWLPLWKERFGQSTPPWNTRPWCYKNQQLTSRFCGGFAWCLVDGVAERGVQRLRACGSRSSTVACEAGQLDSYARAGLGDTAWGPWLAWGHWPGPVAVGHLGLGALAWPHGSGHCPRSARANGADVPDSPGPDTLELWCSLFLSVWCYAEATRIATKTADDWERGKWQYPKTWLCDFAAMSQNSTTIRFRLAERIIQ